jgi:hypothetical protein
MTVTPARREARALSNPALFALNRTLGAESYLDEDSGIGLQAAIVPRHSCDNSCDLLAGSDSTGVIGGVTIWDTRVLPGLGVMASDCDQDADGISNEVEGIIGTGVDRFDTDRDGLTDYQEVVGHPVGARRRGEAIYTAPVIPITVPGADDSESLPLDDANPLVQDVFFEVDFMEAGPLDVGNSHRPYPALAADLTTIFGDAAWTGRGRIVVHVAPTETRAHLALARESGPIPFSPEIGLGRCNRTNPLPPFPDGGPPITPATGPVDFCAIKADRRYFNPIRNQIYHYVVAGRTQFQPDQWCSDPRGRGALHVLCELARGGMGYG